MRPTLFFARASLLVVVCLGALAVQGAEQCRISGRVALEGGQPLAGITLRFSAGLPPVATGADGRYAVVAPKGLGEVTITPEKPGCRFTPAARRVWTSDGDATADFQATQAAPAGRVAQADLERWYVYVTNGSSAFWNGTAPVRTAVRNSGTAAAPAFHIQFRLSQDTVLSGDDILLGVAGGGDSALYPALAAGETGAEIETAVKIPAAPPAGWTGSRFTLLLVVDSAGEVAESNETNNATGYTYVTLSDGPDLQGALLAAPANALWGNDITVRFRIKNAGAADAGAFRVSLVLTNPSGTDEYWLMTPDGQSYGYAHPALAAGVTGEEVAAVVHIPRSIPNGAGWGSQLPLVLRIDTTSQVRETDEENNSGQMGEGLDRVTLSLSQGPDLVATASSAQLYRLWGGPLVVTLRPENEGQVDAGTCHAAWYLSEDRYLSDDDMPLLPRDGAEAIAVPAIPASTQGRSQDAVLQLPSTPPAWWTTGRDICLLVRIDSANEVTEGFENNNVSYMGAYDIALGPDLQGAGLSAPATAFWDSTIQVTSRVKNAGLAGAGAFDVKWYLQDSAGAHRTLLYRGDISGYSERHHDALAAGETGDEFPVTLVLPTFAPYGWGENAGTLLLEVDTHDAVHESDERNNSGEVGEGLDRVAITITSGPNLVPQVPSCPEEAGWGGVLRCGVYVRNPGRGPAGAFDIQFFLRSGGYNAPDIPLAIAGTGATTLRHPAIAKEWGGPSQNVALQLPETPPPAPPHALPAYTLVMKVDTGEEVAETVETDNTVVSESFLVEQKPDLQGSSFQAPAMARWGSSISVQGRVRNAGQATSGAMWVAWYLAKDAAGTDGILLEFSGNRGRQLFVDELAAGTESPLLAVTLDVPASPPAGWTGTQFYLLMKTDMQYSVSESDEGNNFGQVGDGKDRQRITVGDAPDLLGAKCTTAAAASWGGTLTVQAQVRNAGPAPAGAFRVEWFLAEERAGAGPLRLSRAAGQGTYSARPALAASTTAPAFSVILQLPAAPPSGWIGTRFVLLMKTDSANDVGESNEGNNFGQVGDGLDRWPLTITAPDLMGALCAGPTAANWGSAIAVRGRVRNAGTGASPSFQVQWFLSASTGGTNPVPLLRAGLTTGIYSHTSVAAGATGPEFAVNLQLPDRAPTGWSATTLYLFMGTDPANKVVESSETNNFARMGVGVDSCAFRLGSGADLQGALCTAPPSALWGSTIKVQGRVRNAGSLPAGQFRVQFYLSRDGLGSADDVLLSRSAGAGTYYLHPALAAQALGATFTVTLLLPTAAPAGWSAITSGTIIMRSDASALVPELYESNNFGQVGVGLDKAPITAGMLPDLQGCRLEVTPSALWGARVQVRAQVRNVGAAAGTFSVAFYLASSLDAKATRVLIKQPNGASLVSHAALAAGAAGPSFIVSLVLPATAPAGWPTAGGFLLMRTDSAGAVPESNENNNFGEVGLWKDRAFFVAGMQPDLAGATCSAPTIAFWGDTLAVNARVRNLSTGASDRFRIQWYLSQDTTGSADDLLLPLADGGGTYYSHPGLAAGAYGARFVVSVVLPAALPAGWTGDRFHVIMKSDAANQVAESNESNNFGQRGYGYDRSDLTITQARPDLSGRRCTSPAGSSAWGGTLPVTCQVRNGGSAPAGRFRVEWYLRGSGEPRLLSLADGMGSYYLHPALAAGATGLEFTVELQLPSTPLLDGYGNDFFVVMRCDPLNEVAESDEGNNFGEVGDDLDRTIVTVTAPMPDLRGALLDAPATAAWGSAMRVAARVANIGALASGRFRLQWYLSKDAVPTFDDVALPLVGGMGYLSHPGIAGGAEGANLAVDLQLPDAPPEGWTGTNCTLIMHVDSARQVEEVREDNNFGEAGAGLDSDVLAVTAVLPDLQGSRCLGPTAAAWGDALPVQVSVRNAGTAASGRFRLRWYLSRDAAGSADDLPLPLVDGMGDYYSHAGIAAGTNGTPVIVELQLPDALPAGWTGTAFTLIIKVDADAQVPESNEGNNFGQMGAGLDRAAITVR